jgi:hypothetical protein
MSRSETLNLHHCQLNFEVSIEFRSLFVSFRFGHSQFVSFRYSSPENTQFIPGCGPEGHVQLCRKPYRMANSPRKSRSSPGVSSSFGGRPCPWNTLKNRPPKRDRERENRSGTAVRAAVFTRAEFGNGSHQAKDGWSNLARDEGWRVVIRPEALGVDGCALETPIHR